MVLTIIIVQKYFIDNLIIYNSFSGKFFKFSLATDIWQSSSSKIGHSVTTMHASKKLVFR